VQLFREVIAPLGYAYAQQSFKFLQRTSFTMRKLLLCFILREKSYNMKLTKFLKEKCKEKEKHCFLLLQKRIRVGSFPFFPFSEKQIFVQSNLPIQKKTTHCIPHI